MIENQNKELTQEFVREKFRKYYQRQTQREIADNIGVPRQLLSAFKTGKKELWQTSLHDLNDYLDTLMCN